MAWGPIKGSGEAAIAAIVAAREAAGAFTGLFDLARRVDKKAINRRVLEALVKAGAFDRLAADRARLLASVGMALEAANQAAQGSGQGGLFGEPAAADAEPLADVPSWSDAEKLLQEKSALGYYLSGHPFTAYAPEVRCFAKKPLAELEPGREVQTMAGIIAALRTQMTRRGKMAILLLDDDTTPLEVAIFNEQFEKYRDWLKEDALLVVEGKVSRDDYSGGLRITADQLYDLAGARNRFARELSLELNGQADAARLLKLLTDYRQGSQAGRPVLLNYHNGSAQCQIRLGEGWQVSLQDRLLESLRGWLDNSSVTVVY